MRNVLIVVLGFLLSFTLGYYLKTMLIEQPEKKTAEEKRTTGQQFIPTTKKKAP